MSHNRLHAALEALSTAQAAAVLGADLKTARAYLTVAEVGFRELAHVHDSPLSAAGERGLAVAGRVAEGLDALARARGEATAE